MEYLRDVLPRLARCVRLSELPDLLPASWKAARAGAAAEGAGSAPTTEPVPAAAD